MIQGEQRIMPSHLTHHQRDPNSPGTKSGGTVGRFLGVIGKQGLARKNRYKVYVEGIGPNKAIKKVPSLDLATLNLMCESIAFPAQNLRSTPDTLRFGPEREQVQGVTYGEITASFICSTDMREKRFFEEWHKLVFNQDSWEVSYYDQFIGSMQILQDDRQDDTAYRVKLFEVYPKTITQMDVGYAQNDAYHSLSIEFQYHKWREVPTDIITNYPAITTPFVVTRRFSDETDNATPTSRQENRGQGGGGGPDAE